MEVEVITRFFPFSLGKLHLMEMPLMSKLHLTSMLLSVMKHKLLLCQ